MIVQQTGRGPRQWVVVFLVVGFAIALMVPLAADLSWADPSKAENDQFGAMTYPVNRYGMTYGSVADAAEDGHEPDLIEAVATNGQEGYIRNSELAVASHENEAPAQNMQNEQIRMEQAAELFQQKVTERVGDADFSVAEARAVLEDMPLLAASAIRVDRDALDMGSTALEGLATDDLLECYVAVDEAMMQYIPVYLSDGKTIIGEFPVSQL